MRNYKKILFLKAAKLMRGEKSTVPCIISAGTRIAGNITDGDIIHIDGRLEGDVTCRELIIGSTGAVTGKVKAKSLELYGVLNGSLAVENLFIAGSATFIGDSVYKTIAIEPGAVLEGKCAVSKAKSAEPKPVEPKTSDAKVGEPKVAADAAKK